MNQPEERRAGQLLAGRYRLVERLGRGGFGDVWRAEELLPDGGILREVALKLLAVRVSHAADFSAEARIIASLRHPALVTVYAAGVLELPEPVPFVAMDLLRGRTLASFVSVSRPVAWRRVLSWLRQAAAALDVIHQAGVVHLDLKPANLLLTDDDEVKVLDFGIAQQGALRPRMQAEAVPAEHASDVSTAAFLVAHEQSGEAAAVTEPYQAVGTPGFMAPEMFEGATLTAATDAYALAACFAQLVSGQLPQLCSQRLAEGSRSSAGHGGWLAEVQAATVQGRIRDLRQELPELPRGVAALLQRWLALDPALRKVDAGGLRAELDEIWQRPHGVPANPYQGLQSYGDLNEGWLEGRSRESGGIAHDFLDQPAVLLRGKRGVGVRSLVRAGVIPQLARRFADARDDWHSCDVVLADALTETAGLGPAIEQFLVDHGGGGGGDDPVQALCEWAERGPVGVVVVLFGLEALGQDEGGLLQAQTQRLFELCRDGVEGLRVLATVDESAEMAEKVLGQLGEEARLWMRFVGPLDASHADELVRGPAKAADRPLDGAEAVVVELQRELEADGRRLGIVSGALQSWWDADSEGPLRGAAWKAAGGLSGWLVARAESVMAGLDECAVASVEMVLLRLVFADGRCRTLPQETVAQLFERYPASRESIDELAHAGVLNRFGGVLSLAHPVLAEQWPWLHERRLHHLEWLAFSEEVRSAAQRWNDASRKASLLWPRESMRTFQRHQAALEPTLSREELSFLNASTRNWKMHWLFRVLAAMLVLGISGAAFWLVGVARRRAARQAAALAVQRQQVALEQMLSRSRRSGDPYHRVALLAGAIDLGAADPVHAFELMTATHGVAPVRFVTMQKIARPAFPWGGRWLLGATPLHATVFDFGAADDRHEVPLEIRLLAHEQGLYDVVAFAFDTSFITRGLDGQLKVWRLADDGSLSLAAVSPMRCQRGLSPVLVAAHAPVIACAGDSGMFRWDLRDPHNAQADAFVGRPLQLSADGRWLAASRLRKVLLWNPQDARRHEVDVAHAPTIARFNPRERAIALVRPDALDLVTFSEEPTIALTRFTFQLDPVKARWHEGGMDLAVCDASGGGQWHYLRDGGRASTDREPTRDDGLCEPQLAGQPRRLRGAQDIASLFAGERSSRTFEGGWELPDGRLLARDLVIVDPEDDKLQRLVGYRAEPLPSYGAGESVVKVVRLGKDRVAWQVGEEVRLSDMAGKELLRTRGHLLARCDNGRVLAWRKKGVHAPEWEVFGAHHLQSFGKIARRPGFMLGVDPGCQRLFVQWHDGTLAAWTLGETGSSASAEVTELEMPSARLQYAGYVYDVRPSQQPLVTSRGGGVTKDAPESENGLWLAFSGGAMARVSGSDGRLVEYGLAMPRATAMADGPGPGQLLFADDTGVVLRSASGAPDRQVIAALHGRQWEDMRLLPDGRTLALSWAHGLSVVDLPRAEIVAEFELPFHGRMAPWDDEGSLLVWPFSFMGQPRGRVIPVGATLAHEIGVATSNLRATLNAQRRPVIRAVR